MSISSIRLLRYSLRLNTTLEWKNGTTLSTREGFLIELRDEIGALSYGDIAPLPGWSSESISEAEASTVSLLQRAASGDGLESLPEVLGDAAAWHALPPSVRCGLSMALQRYWACEEGAELYQFLCPFPRKGVPLAPLITESGVALEIRLDALSELEPLAVKLKVGTETLDTDIDRVGQVAEKLGPGCTLRLDANKAFDFDSAVEFAQRIKSYGIAYIEEPLSEPKRLPEFHRLTNIPYALDETAAPLLSKYFDIDAGRLDESVFDAQDFSLQDFAAVLESASTVVVKPTLVGEFGRLTLMSRALGSEACRWVVSSAYESGVGIAASAQLAGALDTEDAAAGLDTYRYLEEDVLKERLPLDEKRPSLGEIAKMEKEIDPSRAQEVWSDAS